ncbi:hypothetical protein CEP54_014112 [Fusarium duplospermum]|uniref:Uncharacterized protein n=1 Tax=Fusarium duplospermum TaxID=1325734 RepID=A0A428NYE8_9HYPO|nr:hypothetical protein CEP54_014112 [Fusarium duplospermum]
MSSPLNNIVGNDPPVPEAFWDQLHQWLQFGGRLSSENDQLRQQIANMQVRKERLLAYKATYDQMADTQNQLIISLSAGISGNKSQPRPSYGMQIDPTLSVDSLKTSTLDAVSLVPEPDSLPSVLQLLEPEYPSGETV